MLRFLNIRIFPGLFRGLGRLCVFQSLEGKPVEQYDIVYGPIADDKIGLANSIANSKDGEY